MRRSRLGWLANALTLREQSHRRATLLAIACLLLLGTMPVFGHHLPFDTSQLLAGVDHIGVLCVAALHLLFAPVHRAVHLAIVAGLMYAAFNRYQAWRVVRQSLDSLEVRRARRGDGFWEAAQAASVDPHLLRIVPGLPNPAFTAGLWTPRIYVSEGLGGRLNRAELSAVLAHERAHVARRDPLRLTVIRALACTLFWIPALRRLADDVSDQVELLADDAAAGEQPLVLASAILNVAGWSSGNARLSAGVGFLRAELLERRVRRLAGEETPVRSHVTRRSLAGAAAALALVWISSALMIHPLPAHAEGAHDRHCEHPLEAAWVHLFCARHAGTSECPHGHG